MSILKDSASRYGLVSQILHWGFAALIIFTFISGQIFEDAARSEKAELMNRHATLAILLMAFLVLRAVWRTSQSSPDEINRHKVLVLANKTVKLALYAIPLALAVTGSLTVLSGGFSVPFLGQELLIGWSPADRDLHEVLEDVHGVLTKLLMATFAVHVLASLWHQFVKRDGVLTRMLPGSLKKT